MSTQAENAVAYVCIAVVLCVGIICWTYLVAHGHKPVWPWKDDGDAEHVP